MRVWRSRQSARCFVFLLAVIFAAQGVGMLRAGYASTEKEIQSLTAKSVLVLSSEQQSFPLELLGAQTDADPADAPRLTYFVESGGDVIRLEQDEVSIIGWGRASIRILADETIRYRSAEQLVQIEVVRYPRLLCNISEITDRSAYIDVTLDSGSYSPGEVQNWAAQFRRAGTEEYQPIAQNWPSQSPFFITLTGLSPDTSYDVLVSAETSDRLNGGALPLETHYRVRTAAPGGGTVSGTVAGWDAERTATVSLQAGQTLLAVAKDLRSGDPFSFRGVPAGRYNLVLRCGNQTLTTAVEADPQTPANVALQLGPTSSAVYADTAQAPGVVAVGLDQLAADAGLDASENILPEMRLVSTHVGDTAPSSVWRLSADNETAGFSFALSLHQTVRDALGRVIDDKTVPDFLLPVTVCLPESLRGMEGFRIFRDKGGLVEPLTCTYDDAQHALTFSADSSSTYTVFHINPNWIAPQPASPDAQGTVSEQELAFSPAPTDPAEPPPNPYLLPSAIGCALLLVVALLVVLRRRALKEAAALEDLFEEDELDDAEDAEENFPPVEEEPEPEPEPEPEQEALALIPAKASPWEEKSFFDGIEERKALKMRFDNGEIDEQEFKDLEREILLRM